ncbi:MAG: poly-gamma-glutamate system protein [Longimicrobiales bacterium]
MTGSTRNVFVTAALVSLAAWATAERLSPPESVPWTPAMRAAAERMGEALAAVRDHRDAAGIPPDASTDPNHTGLVGPAYDELFTTLGDLEAKRTATNPDAAALLVHLLGLAGVEAGDTVAIAASASFPALLVAALTATEALGAHPVAVLSLGASSYGLTDPDFNLLDLHRLLVAGGVVRTPPAAASLGGTRDRGEEWETQTRERVLERLRSSGVPLILEADLASSVARRMELFGAGAGGARPPVSAFVNVGGADANVGISPSLLALRPGLLPPADIPLPPAAQRGVVHAMATAGVPVIHLLDMRGLAGRHGLPWDPVPSPASGTTRLLRGDAAAAPLLPFIAGTWLAAMVLLAAVGVMISRRSRKTSTLPLGNGP